MGKLIIDNQTDLEMQRILDYVKNVIQAGRISNYGKQYCYLTKFADGINISAYLNPKSDRLVIWKDT